MRKHDLRFEVIANESLNASTSLLRLRPETNCTIPELFPGQFVNIKVESANVFLRRPISICNYDIQRNELWLMVKNAGKGTSVLCGSLPGDLFDILLPLGNGFILPSPSEKKILLIGGGVGVAPLYFLARWFQVLGVEVHTLMGARSAKELIFVDKFREIGETYISTDDGSLGEKGVVTVNSKISDQWDAFYVCGPLPMMKAVASLAVKRNIDCQVSLENHMACGLGACLCCVEDTVEGNKCVCTEGPVFNIRDLKW